jgi:lipid A 3-O-deacylase
VLRHRIVISLLIAFISLNARASDFGITGAFPVISKDPHSLHGYQAQLIYYPKSLTWNQTSISFNAGVSHWWVKDPHHHSLNILALAPSLRYYFFSQPNWSPFIDLSIGLAYLTRSRLDDRNLGMHFAFQDEVGIGAALGVDKQLFIKLSAIHYSNGSLCNMNAGITVPVFLTVGYRF